MKLFKLLILGLAIFLSMPGCKKDSVVANKTLVGTWENKQPNTTAIGRSEVYTFNDNGTFEERITAYNPVSNQTLGFIYKTIGKYTVKGDEITLKIDTYYHLADYNQPYVAQSELVAETSSVTSVYNWGLSDNKNSLSLTIQCPINALCIGLQEYNRVTVSK